MSLNFLDQIYHIFSTIEQTVYTSSLIYTLKVPEKMQNKQNQKVST